MPRAQRLLLLLQARAVVGLPGSDGQRATQPNAAESVTRRLNCRIAFSSSGARRVWPVCVTSIADCVPRRALRLALLPSASVSPETTAQQASSRSRSPTNLKPRRAAPRLVHSTGGDAFPLRSGAWSTSSRARNGRVRPLESASGLFRAREASFQHVFCRCAHRAQAGGARRC